MLKLKLQYFGHLMRRADSLEKTLLLGKIEGRSSFGDAWVGSRVRERQRGRRGWEIQSVRFPLWLGVRGRSWGTQGLEF